MQFISARRTMISILGFVLMAALGGIMGIRIFTVVNGSGTVNFSYDTNAGVFGSYSLDSGHTHSELLPDVAGTTLFIDLSDPDGEQVFVSVWGSN